MPTFSALDRSEHLRQLQHEHWDLLVIGGGITGAGILLDAQTRGLKAALVEKNDFASGTSSRSTKLIHGGLRYLKQFELGLVREVGRERAIVHRNARHIVRPEAMLLPMYKNGSLGRFSGGLGLWIYDLLADVESPERRRMLSREQIIDIEPLLRRDLLIGGALYYEYRTDDARLVIEVLKTAVKAGALALNYCEVTDFMKEEAKVSGVRCSNRISGAGFEIRAKAVINAAGPWVDDVRQIDDVQASSQLLLTNGTHVVFDKARFPIEQSMYFDVPGDGRMIFAIVRGDKVYCGTTDIVFKGDLDSPKASEEEIDYILEAVNYRFPTAKLTRDDIKSTWAGLRPLILQEGKSPSEVSRKDEIFVSDSGLLSIAGGKLSGYRKMAERAVDKLINVHELPASRCRTADMRLSGCSISSEKELIEAEDDFAARCQATGIPAQIASHWFRRYGSNATQLLSYFAEFNTSSVELRAAAVRAEVKYCVEYEMAHTLDDIGTRRTAMKLFGKELWDAIRGDVVNYLESLLPSADTFQRIN